MIQNPASSLLGISRWLRRQPGLTLPLAPSGSSAWPGWHRLHGQHCDTGFGYGNLLEPWLGGKQITQSLETKTGRPHIYWGSLLLKILVSPKCAPEGFLKNEHRLGVSQFYWAAFSGEKGEGRADGGRLKGFVRPLGILTTFINHPPWHSWRLSFIGKINM